MAVRQPFGRSDPAKANARASQPSSAASSATTAGGSAPQPFIERPGIGLERPAAGREQGALRSCARPEALTTHDSSYRPVA